MKRTSTNDASADNHAGQVEQLLLDSLTTPATDASVFPKDFSASGGGKGTETDPPMPGGGVATN